MALNERNRNALYQGLIRTVEDEEAVEAMLSHFPAREQDEPATEEFVAAVEARLDQRITLGLAETNQRMTEGFAELNERMTDGLAETNQRMTDGLAETNQRMTEGFAARDAAMTEGFAETNQRITLGLAETNQRMTEGFATLRDEVHVEMRRWFLWSYGAMFVLLAAVVTAAKILQ